MTNNKTNIETRSSTAKNMILLTLLFYLWQLAEMQRMEDTNWEWVRTISTPTSTCFASYWTALAS